MSKRPLIAIVGRPSVGKSTLFNRLIGRRRAIVEASPGVTRDRHFADTELLDRPVTVVDTGGFVPEGKEEPLAVQIRQQALAAVQEGDVVLFVVDGKAGVLPSDEELAKLLRKSSKPLILVVNKLENAREAATNLADFHTIGVGTPVGVSAEHGLGFEDLIERIDTELGPYEAPAPDAPKEQGAPIRIAIVGRPNVGKSTLVNALVGEERVIVSPIAGTTRDPINSPLTYNGRDVILTDTAGIRRKAVITQKVEQFSVLGALRAAEDADVVALVIDATEPGVEQDQKIAAVALEKGRALLIVVNKWDVVQKNTREDGFRDTLKWYLNFVSWAPMVFVSAKAGNKVHKVIEVALQLADQQGFRATTPLLNRIVDHIKTEHPMPIVNGKPLKIYYAMQVGDTPPAFAFICNSHKVVPDRYARYVGNYLRETFKLKVPIRLFWRERPGKADRALQGKRFKTRDENKRRAEKGRSLRKRKNQS